MHIYSNAKIHQNAQSHALDLQGEMGLRIRLTDFRGTEYRFIMSIIARFHI